ncbi:alkaline phosphatase [Solimonas sp. SE-A11]|uniref:alkaline phosphatase D family protein n=1 Tax=Solimonas sp. SE-A11 TaxID=3054954 RepID=UPI00259CD98A|nr:alkaline phosphatase D family protein [Solimonas sp. SE-A11]MDM4769197.1 alkaline phosphatase D family protein [Solimonas sp. SE-A11]
MPPFTRRAFVVATGATLVSLLSGCGNSDDREDGDGGLDAADFTHGVASGDPLPDAVMLWARAVPATAAARSARLHYVVARDPGLTQVVLRGSVTSAAERDWTVKLDLRDLAPDTAYYYCFESASARSPVGRARTAPLGGVARLRLAFVTCSNYVAGYFHAYRRVAERSDLHAVVHLGDYIYENGSQDQVRPHEPAKELVGLADYRQRYAQYRADADLQELHRQHPMIWIWDDHEVANNAWKDDAEAHDADTEGSYAERRFAAMQAAFEWMPIRAPDAADPSRVWRGFRFGDLADLTMIDARHHGRDAPLPPNSLFGDAVPVFTQSGDFADASRHILGPVQEAWLGGQLAANTAHWQLIGNQVYFSPLKLLGGPRALGGGGLYLSNDKWDGYDPARSRVLEMIRARSGGNVVILTGDAHEAYAFEVTDDPNGLGYQPLSGQGSAAVEFVATSITSRGDLPAGNGPTALLAQLAANAEQLLRLTNPHLKYYQNTLNGYLLLDITPERLQAEFWMVPRVTERNDEQALTQAFTVQSGSNHLVSSRQASEPITGGPAAAP